MLFMWNNLLNDIGMDARFSRNLLRIAAFMVLLMALDFAVTFMLEKGVRRFYGLDRQADVLLVGHSHLMLAVDKRLFEEGMHMQVAKYTREGVNVADRFVMLEHYFDSRPGKCRLIVYGIDPWLFTGKGLSANSYKLFYPFMDYSHVDSYVRTHAENPYDYFSHKYFRSSRFNSLLINSALRGYLGNWSNLKFGQLDTLKLKREIAVGDYRRISFDRENIDTFNNTLPYLSAHAQTVILLNTPISGILSRAVRGDDDKVMAMIRSMAIRYPNVHVVDLSPEFEWKSECFFDPIHMNPEGQKRVTVAFSAVAESLLVRTAQASAMAPIGKR
jgi:hypothetical protein